MTVRKSIREFVETATEVLEPSESDLRVVQPEPFAETETAEANPDPIPPPVAPHVRPDAKELEKEHRGY